ncbi:hypothetical protein DFH08DRAFT_817462 [Mycena albidolilacea]|uniref:Uncharacterized protein n=1 Tax=Mycena albidolilacea TaxID=1033008 RepID=A0AAD6ZJ49_9AGAR|nr:hypothetical protein DFH08DRAFT_817462 [Mycena albidolilacea]
MAPIVNALLQDASRTVAEKSKFKELQCKFRVKTSTDSYASHGDGSALLQVIYPNSMYANAIKTSMETGPFPPAQRYRGVTAWMHTLNLDPTPKLEEVLIAPIVALERVLGVTAFPPYVDAPTSTLIDICRHAAIFGYLRLCRVDDGPSAPLIDVRLRSATSGRCTASTRRLRGSTCVYAVDARRPTSLKFTMQPSFCYTLHMSMSAYTQWSVYPSSTGVDRPSVYMGWERSESSVGSVLMQILAIQQELGDRSTSIVIYWGILIPVAHSTVRQRNERREWCSGSTNAGFQQCSDFRSPTFRREGPSTLIPATPSPVVLKRKGDTKIDGEKQAKQENTSKNGMKAETTVSQVSWRARIRQIGKSELDGSKVAGAINDGGGVDRYVADIAMKEGEDGGPPI